MHRNGTVIVGNWNNGMLDGKAVIFTPFRARILTNFNEGKLSGWTISFYGTNIIRCAQYYENQVDGEKLTYDEKERMWMSSKCAPDGSILSLVHAEKGSRQELPAFVRSQELRQLFNRYVNYEEYFLQLSVMEQFSINAETNYIGFVDEQKKPCGLGCAFSEKQMYFGNFFEGVLEHYGRMMFENGDIYQGQLSGGSFWGRGVYYSPFKN